MTHRKEKSKVFGEITKRLTQRKKWLIRLSIEKISSIQSFAESFCLEDSQRSKFPIAVSIKPFLAISIKNYPSVRESSDLRWLPTVLTVSSPEEG